MEKVLLNIQITDLKNKFQNEEAVKNLVINCILAQTSIITKSFEDKDPEIIPINSNYCINCDKDTTKLLDGTCTACGLVPQKPVTGISYTPHVSQVPSTGKSRKMERIGTFITQLSPEQKIIQNFKDKFDSLSNLPLLNQISSLNPFREYAKGLYINFLHHNTLEQIKGIKKEPIMVLCIYYSFKHKNSEIPSLLIILSRHFDVKIIDLEAQNKKMQEVFKKNPEIKNLLTLIDKINIKDLLIKYIPDSSKQIYRDLFNKILNTLKAHTDFLDADVDNIIDCHLAIFHYISKNILHDDIYKTFLSLKKVIPKNSGISFNQPKISSYYKIIERIAKNTHLTFS